MATAGRILIIPKGAWGSGIAYEALDLVSHNGNSWLCKKTAVGIEPSVGNAEYWFKFTDNATVDVELEEIRNSLANKANQTSLNALAETVASKADQNALDELAETVEGMTDLTKLEELTKIVAGKADQTALDELSETVDGKADLASLEEFNEKMGGASLEGIGDGTVTGAIVAINNNYSGNETKTISIDSCSTVQEIANTMLANVGKVGQTRCGQLDNYPSSSALGKPNSSWNYARAYAEVAGPYLIRLTAMQLLGSGIKTGHIFFNDNTWVWTGWA